MGETILKMQGIQKYFSGVHALDNVSFDLQAGEVHALMGENGAGKSTLIKVLCGIHKRDGGTIEFFGEDVHFNNIAESQAAGISVIHQELNMMNHLTVAQNMFIGREFFKNGLIDDKAMEDEAQHLFDKMGVKIDPSVKLGDLTVGKQQMVEIAKVVAEYDGIVAAHIRNEGDTLVESTEEFIRVLKASGARGVHSHHKCLGEANRGKVNTTLDMIQKAIDEGVEVYCDVYPYIASGTTLESRFIPDQYRQGPDKLRAFLSDPQIIAQIKEQNLAKWGADLSWVLVNVCPSHPEFLGKTMNEVAEILGTDTFDAVYELLRQDAGAVSCTFFAMAEEDVEKVMRFPRTMICTDSRAHGQKIQHHPRMRGSFPRALGVYVRERNVLSWEEMIHRMTDMPATYFGVKNKGRVEVGYDADLCIFDAARIIDKCDFTDCLAHAEGLNFVLVNGQIVAKDAYHTGARPGRVITDLVR
mgnify:CR=1 FL=1